MPTPTVSSSKGVWLIAIFKIVKGVLLICAGLGAIALLHKDVSSFAERLLDGMHLDPDGKWAHWLLAKAGLITDKQLKQATFASFGYSGLVFAEGFGLMLAKRWAEYLTVIATGVFVPFELYALMHHPTAGKAVALALNVAIVAYLWLGIRKAQALKGER